MWLTINCNKSTSSIEGAVPCARYDGDCVRLADEVCHSNAIVQSNIVDVAGDGLAINGSCIDNVWLTAGRYYILHDLFLSTDVSLCNI